MSHNDAIEDTNFIQNIRAWLIARPKLFAIGYLLALIASEAITVLIDPRTGIFFHGLILLVAMLLAALTSDQKGLRFVLPLALPPLIRLLSLSLPLISFNVIYWYAVIGVPLFIATFLTIRATGLSADLIGLRISWRELPLQILIGLSGFILGYIEYQILHPVPIVSMKGWASVLLTALILLVFTGFLEELIFRGVMQSSAVEKLDKVGIIFVALVFTVLHIGYRSVQDIIFIFSVAIIFGLLVFRFKTLLGVSIAHGLINISLYLIFPYLLM
jgi:membrane protease YdiL (CAAX protease family)